MREFVTAAREQPESAIEGAQPIEFSLDGVKYTAHPPTPGQMALVMAGQASNEIGEQIAAVIDFMDVILEPDGQRMLRRRLMDRDDPFDLEQVQQVTLGLLEEWTGTPTGSLSGSSS